MFLTGAYERKYNRYGIISVPPKWMKKETKEMYSMMYFDDIEQTFYLRIFFEKDDMQKFVQELKENTEFEILRCSRHRLISGTNYIRLP